jgi:glutaredoxin 3
MSADVVVYTTDYCPYCTRAKALLQKRGAAFREIRVDERPDLRSWLSTVTHQRTVPQVFVNGAPLGGFTDIAALDQKGQLQPLLDAAPKPTDPELRV